MEYIKTFDTYFLNNIHSLTTIPFLGYFFYIMSDFVMFIYPIFLIGYWLHTNFYIKDFKKQYEIKSKLLFVFFVSMISIISLLVISKFEIIPIRDRPETALINSDGLILSHLPDNSFPSNHATTAMAFCTALYLIGLKREFFIFFILGILTGFSRIAVGVHWPTDVLCGFIIGFLLSLILFKYKYYIDKYFSHYCIKLALIFKL